MFLKYSILDGYELIGFTTTCRGGVSESSNYSSFNLSQYSNDVVSHVAKNREILCADLGVSSNHLYVPYQTHEDKIKIIDAKFLNLLPSQQVEELYGYDALITQEKDICIGITTADCVPLLIYDPQNHVLATIHAGWKGTVKCIGVKTVKKMIEVFGSQPAQLLVVIGPSISPKMFEVGDEVGKVFIDSGFRMDNISFRNESTGKLHIDLWQANILPLLDLGILKEHIEVARICTQENEFFFSARRQTINSGRMITGGVLK